MQSRRFGEEGEAPQRSERIYQDGDKWYFSVRKGIDKGPFTSEEAAKAALVDYVSDQLLIENLPYAQQDKNND